MAEEPRIGVYVCHCGLNIAGVVDVKKVVDYVKPLPGVVVAREHKYVCSDLGQEMIKKDVSDYRLGRVVLSSCPERAIAMKLQDIKEDRGFGGCFEEGD